MKNQFILAFALLLLLTTYNTQKEFTTSSKTNIKEVIIENNFIHEGFDSLENLKIKNKYNIVDKINGSIIKANLNNSWTMRWRGSKS